MLRRKFKAGDRVVYCRMKHKSNPSPRARNVFPSANGDDYVYYIEKFWVVSKVLEDGRLLLTTPRGKTRVVFADDPRLRYATWLERIKYRENFSRSDAALGNVS